MTQAPASADTGRLQERYRRLEEVREEAAETERSAYRGWLDALHAHDVARDRSTRAWTSYWSALDL